MSGLVMSPGLQELMFLFNRLDSRGKDLARGFIVGYLDRAAESVFQIEKAEKTAADCATIIEVDFQSPDRRR